jgi:hypothetical protein
MCVRLRIAMAGTIEICSAPVKPLIASSQSKLLKTNGKKSAQVLHAISPIPLP